MFNLLKKMTLQVECLRSATDRTQVRSRRRPDAAGYTTHLCPEVFQYPRG